MLIHPFDYSRLAVELSYTLIVVFFCFMIYIKTKEMYDLTKYKGIQYFRITFLFFGLAYLFRFAFILLLLIRATFDVYSLSIAFKLVPLILSGYFSTMAILSLTYSTIWKKIHIKHTFLISNAIAVLISGIALISISPIPLIVSQAVLLIFTMGYTIYSQSRKISPLFVLYIMFFLFWIVNLFTLGPKRFLPFEIQILLNIVSVVLIGIIYYKVDRWTK